MKKVLVVDSDKAMIRTLTGLLKSQGEFLDVLTAANSSQALEILEKTSIDLVIGAIRLPKVDGFKLVAKVTKLYPSIKVIIMTKNAHPLLRARIKRFPSTVHLDQSHDISMLTKRVFTELQIDYGGHVRGLNLSSFLQMMELEGCTCTLKITTKDLAATLWLKNGELIAAKTVTEEGEEAALNILSWQNVHIDIDYAIHQKEHQFDTPLMTLILESSQLRDETLSNNTNNRAHGRYDLLVALDYDMKKMTRQCFLRDISQGGAYIETDQELAIGETIALVLSSPSLKNNCSIQATVVRKDAKGAGFRFLSKSSEQQLVIKAMINSSLKARHKKEQRALSPTQVV